MKQVPEVAAAVQSLKVASMNLGRRRKQLCDKENHFHQHRDAVEEHVNKQVATRQGQLIKRQPFSSSVSTHQTDSPQDVLATDLPPSEFKIHIKKTDLLPTTKQKKCFPINGQPMGSTAMCSRRYGCTRPVVRYTRLGGSKLLVNDFRARMQGSLAIARTSGLKFPYVLEHCKWDETEQQCTTIEALVERSGMRALMNGTANTTKRWPIGTTYAVRRRLKMDMARANSKAVLKRQRRQAQRGKVRVKGGRQVMIVKRRYSFPLSDEPMTDRVIPQVCEPLILKTPDASNIEAGLDAGRVVTHEELREVSDAIITVAENDAAAPNITINTKCQKAIIDGSRRGRHYDQYWRFLCAVHQGNLCHVICIENLEGSCLQMVNDLFCCSSVMRQPGYWSKILQELPEVLSDHSVGIVIAADTSPPAGAREANTAFLISCDVDIHDQSVQSLLDTLNGFWTDPFLFVYVEPGDPLPNRAEVVRKACIALQDVLFNSMPELPIPSRWFRVMTTYRWYRLAYGIHRIGITTTQRALGPILFKCATTSRAHTAKNTEGCSHDDAIIVPIDDYPDLLDAKDANGPEDAIVASIDANVDKATSLGHGRAHTEYIDPDFVGGLNRDAYQQKVGKRMGRLLHVVSTSSTEWKLGATVVALQPLHYFVAKELAYNRARTEACYNDAVPCPLLDFAHPETSPAVVSQQGYGSMLFSPANTGAIMTVHGIIRRDHTVDATIHEAAMRMLLLGSSSLSARIEDVVESLA